MDTGTHLMIGLGLGGLAMLDPAFSAQPEHAAVIMIGTLAGSNAPDLDMLSRLKGRAAYIRRHRGISHSLPAAVLWTGFITLPLAALLRDVPWWHVAFWVGLSVIVHLLADTVNAYGTKIGWPWRKDWIRWNLAPVFDPFVFLSHLVAVFLWGIGAAAPQAVFPLLYVWLAGYFGWRRYWQQTAKRSLPIQDPHVREGDRYAVLPTASPFRWNVVKQSKDGTYGIGEWNDGRLRWVDQASSDFHPAAEASRSVPEVQAFLDADPIPCVRVHERSWGYEIRWEDMRFRHHQQFPFAAVVLMDFSDVPLQADVGWLSEDRLKKRRRMPAY